MIKEDGRIGLLATALACFRKSTQFGREIRALAWGLRAAMSLARLRERQGEAYAAELAEARQILRDLYTRALAKDLALPTCKKPRR